ncbi:G5 domain-containing protein [Nocardioides sp. C4-1]|uniref:G5 domain-containing protein n=1 Tax=Nocardioides sp. C4-1 TaxID=3151851 RepID=UPI003265D701
MNTYPHPHRTRLAGAAVVALVALVLALLAPVGTASARVPAGDRAAATSSAAPAERAVVHKTVKKRWTMPFRTRVVRTNDLPRGTTKVSRKGRTGVKLVVWRITYDDGHQVSKKKVRTKIVRRPVARIVLKGTRTHTEQRCDPNYSGACVPIASDVDCAGGSGNGPAYVDGPVYVVGDDIYGLDSDGDGVGCE